MNRRKALQTMALLGLEGCFTHKGKRLPDLEKRIEIPYKVDYKAEWIKQGSFPLLHPAYRSVDLIIRNQEGKEEKLKKLLKRSCSGIKADYFVDQAYQDVKNKTPNTLMDYLRERLSENKGRGKTTTNFETFGDSIQTLDEFIDNEWRGDCDDFAIALLTCYQIARNKSSGSLKRSFEHYQMIGITEYDGEGKGHMLNGLLEYNDNFSRVMLTPIEPQKFKDKKVINNIIIPTKKGFFRMEQTEHYPTVETYGADIKWLFNNDVCYYQE